MGISPPDDVLAAAYAPKAEKPKKPEIRFIILHETILQSWLRDLSTYMLAVGLIGTGLVMGSSAMQWFGFLTVLAITYYKGTGKNQFSFEEARAYIDKLEKELKE